jgi:hypothetical protein
MLHYSRHQPVCFGLAMDVESLRCRLPVSYPCAQAPIPYMGWSKAHKRSRNVSQAPSLHTAIRLQSFELGFRTPRLCYKTQSVYGPLILPWRSKRQFHASRFGRMPSDQKQKQAKVQTHRAGFPFGRLTLSAQPIRPQPFDLSGMADLDSPSFRSRLDILKPHDRRRS